VITAEHLEIRASNPRFETFNCRSSYKARGSANRADKIGS
jgi:hypothetical protein